jgi:hypothetical protein
MLWLVNSCFIYERLSNDMMIMNDELENMWNEEVVAYFKALRNILMERLRNFIKIFRDPEYAGLDRDLR